jgi:hypothetical protein
MSHPDAAGVGLGNEVDLMRNEPRQREQIFRVLNRLSQMPESLTEPSYSDCDSGYGCRKAAQVMSFALTWTSSASTIRYCFTLPAKLDEWKFERPTLIYRMGAAWPLGTASHLVERAH